MWTLIQNGSPSLITAIKAAVNGDVSDQERNEFEGKWSDDSFTEFFPGIDLDDKEVAQEFSVTVVQGSLGDLTPPTPPNPYVTPSTVTFDPNLPQGPGPTGPFNPNLPGPPNIGQGQ